MKSVIDIIFDENPTKLELFTVACHLAVFWCIILETGRKVIANLVKDKKWLKDALVREYHREGKKMLETFGTPMPEEEFLETRMQDWGWMQLVLLQHIVGGILCVPSIFNLMDEKTASSLACLSILSEMGWEMQDLAVMFYRRIFLPDGKKLVPDIMLIVMPMHHSLTTLLGIPTILRYRSLKILHWLSFDLQVATGLSLGVGEYTKLLDVSQPNQLFQFTTLTLLGFVACLWGRVFHWTYLIYKFTQIWIQERAWMFLIVGLCVAVIFTVFSYFICIEPFYKRLKKFMGVSAEYKSLPQDASPTHRRSSMVALQNAANDLAAEIASEADFSAEVLAFLENRKSKPSRRESMPASIMQRQRRLSGYKRSKKPTKAASTGMSLLNDPAIRKELEEMNPPSKEFSLKDRGPLNKP